MYAPALDLSGATAQTMSSREVADLTDKRHDNVKRTIEMLAQVGVISLPQAEEVMVQRERRAEKVMVYRLDKRSSLIVVAQLCPEFTARIVDRWQELEAQAAKPAGPALPDFTDPAVAAVAWAEQYRAKQAAQLEAADALLKLADSNAKVDTLTPKAEALDRIARADGSLCITAAAKDLQVRPKDLFAWLQAHQWIYRRPGGSNFLGYQDRIQQGLLEHKVTTVSSSDGSEKIVEQVRITAKGLSRLAQALSQPQAA